MANEVLRLLKQSNLKPQNKKYIRTEVYKMIQDEYSRQLQTKRTKGVQQAPRMRVQRAPKNWLTAKKPAAPREPSALKKDSPFKSSYIVQYQSTRRTGSKPSIDKSIYYGNEESLSDNQSDQSSLFGTPLKQRKHVVYSRKYRDARSLFISKVAALKSTPSFSTFRQDFLKVSECAFGKEPPFTKRWSSYLSLIGRTDPEELSTMYDLVKGGKKMLTVKNLMMDFRNKKMTQPVAEEIINYYKSYQQCPLVIYWFMLNKLN